MTGADVPAVAQEAMTPAAIRAAAIVLHDEACDADTGTCRRWNSTNPGYDPQRHIGYYEARARDVLEAAAPNLAAAATAAEAERWAHKMADVAAKAHAAERERCAQQWRAVLTEHHLAGITCDHETKRDNPVCACSRVHLGWHPTIGAAVQAWLDHVADNVLLRQEGGGT